MQFLTIRLNNRGDNLKKSAITLGLLMVFVPLASNALTFGRSRDAVLLGQPLNLNIASNVESKEPTPEAACFSAEVFYGDSLVGSQNVSVAVSRTSSTELNLLVRSKTLVDEPVVRVTVRATCGINSSRQYVLLPDSPSDMVSNVIPPVRQTLPTASPVVSSPATRIPGINALPPEGSFRYQTAAEEREERRAQRRADARARRSAAALDGQEIPRRTRSKSARAMAANPVDQQSITGFPPIVAKKRTAPAPLVAGAGVQSKNRLKLDMLDLTGTSELSLRASAEMLSQPSTDLQARAQAALAWKAINAQPDDVLRDSIRVKAIETDVRTMLDLTKRQNTELETLKADLAKASKQRYANPLVYALGLLALGALGWAAFLFRQRRKEASPWWGGDAQLDGSESGRTVAHGQISEARSP